MPRRKGEYEIAGAAGFPFPALSYSTAKTYVPAEGVDGFPPPRDLASTAFIFGREGWRLEVPKHVGPDAIIAPGPNHNSSYRL